MVVGALAGWAFERAADKQTWGEPAKRLGVLVMSGFIVGESLFNVALAGLIVSTGEGEPLALPIHLGEGPGMLIAVVAGIAVVGGLYRWAARTALRVST